MISTIRFPKYVTHESDQSRTLGAKLDELLGRKRPQDLLRDPVKFAEFVTELWHNLPCIETESLIHCLPFYIALNSETVPKFMASKSMPAIWQLNEELAQRLAHADGSTDIYKRVLSRFGQEELEQTLALCDLLEKESVDELECFRNAVTSQLE